MVNSTYHPDTGLWSLNLTFELAAPQVYPQKFLYVEEGQSIVYNLTSDKNNTYTFKVPLKVNYCGSHQLCYVLLHDDSTEMVCALTYY